MPAGAETGSQLLVGAQLFLTAGAFLGGVAGLSVLAFAERESRQIDIVGLRFQIPARGNVARGELTHLGLVTAKLAIILATLSGGAFSLMRP